MARNRTNLRGLRPGRLIAAALLAGLGAVPGARAGPEAAAIHAQATGSELALGWFGRSMTFDLALDRPVPFRVFTLDRPRRLVADLAGLDWTGFEPGAIAREGDVAPPTVGRIRAGWARLVLDLPGPLALESAELVPAPGGGARLLVRLARVGEAEYAALSGAPPGVWPDGAAPPMPAAEGAGAVTVAIDPGHGGIDPGAVRDGVREKDTVLAFARALRERLLAEGFRVVLTRAGDDFVALPARVEAARAAGATVFLSIHCNVVEDPAVAGGIVFSRSERGSSPAADRRAREENASGLIAGLDAVPGGGAVRSVLAEIARTGTDARSARLADDLVAALGSSVGVAPANARQSADFEVLRAADMPSVLIELGFLSNTGDRADLLSPAWQARAAEAMAAGLAAWLRRDAESAGQLDR